MKRTFQPNKRKRAKKHGFFARKETNILKSRRKKGRKKAGERKNKSGSENRTKKEILYTTRIGTYDAVAERTHIGSGCVSIPGIFSGTSRTKVLFSERA